MKIEIIVDHSPINSAFWQEKLLFDQSGAHLVFNGTTRNNIQGKKVTHLFYEAYDTMAKKTMLAIAEECIVQYNLLKMILVHRLGRVNLKESSLLIGVSSSHSQEAFLAVEYALKEIKKKVPIWKKEFFETGQSAWVMNQHSN